MLRLSVFLFIAASLLFSCGPATKNSGTTPIDNQADSVSSDTLVTDTSEITTPSLAEINLSYSELIKRKLAKLDTLPEKKHFISNADIVLRKGDSNEFVTTLRKVIFNSDDSTANTMLFDNKLDSAVRAFQYMHGLSSDGIVGRNTYYFLNWDNKKYIKTLSANLNRYNVINDTIIKNGIYINIPEYLLKFYKNDTLLFESEVIVGKKKTLTPVMESEIDYIVYNPCWTVPNSIASKKMLPRMKNDSMYLQNRNMFICQNGVEVNPCDIDFSQYSQSNFPFKVFQRTGPGNALGKVKFMFDNKHSIYLHDTQSKRRFSKDVRAFSHGCIRVNNALDLAQTMLDNDKKKAVNTDYYLNLGYPVKVYLDTEIPIHITYYTCTTDSSNNIIYHKDIYGYDK